MKNDGLLCSPYEMEVDKFAKLWTAYEYECKATVAAGRMEISVVVDKIGNRCHMTCVQVTGMCCGLLDLTELVDLACSCSVHRSSHLQPFSNQEEFPVPMKC